MLDIIKKFIREVNETPEPQAFLHDKKQLAEAALMYHVIAVDGVIRDEERERMREVLTQHFSLSDEEAKHLQLEAKDAEQEAVDLYSFTRTLKHNLSEEDRITIIRHLWEMVFADGVIHELEDNVVWRVAELMGVDSRDRMIMKKEVWKSRNEKSS